MGTIAQTDLNHRSIPAIYFILTQDSFTYQLRKGGDCNFSIGR